MAVRQYVGARYVPKFYQNSQNPNSMVWEGNRSYEALTTVTYNNDSYTSKIPVPAGIGNPAQNPTYWALTGNYNAQMEQYRQDVQGVANDLQTEITNRENADNELNAQIEQYRQTAQGVANDLQTEITNRENADNELTENLNNSLLNSLSKNNLNLVVIGDSYADDDSDFPSVLKNLLNAKTLTKYAHGGACFATNPDNTFLQLIQNIDVNNDANIVVIEGGINDIADTARAVNWGNIYNAMLTLTNTAKTKFPNAIIYMGTCGYYVADNDAARQARSLQLLLVEQLQRACNNTHVNYMNGLNECMHFRDLFIYDGLHPNEYGTQAIAEAIYQCIVTGNYSAKRTVGGSTTFTPVDGASGTWAANSYQCNGVTTFIANSLSLAFTTGQTIVCDGTTSFKIGHAEDKLFFSQGAHYDNIPVNCIIAYYTDKARYYEVNCIMQINQYNDVYIIPKKLDSAGEAFLTINGVTNIVIPEYSLSVPITLA